jgi:hypothetical protein
MTNTRRTTTHRDRQHLGAVRATWFTNGAHHVGVCLEHEPMAYLQDYEPDATITEPAAGCVVCCGTWDAADIPSIIAARQTQPVTFTRYRALATDEAMARFPRAPGQVFSLAHRVQVARVALREGMFQYVAFEPFEVVELLDDGTERVRAVA